jgi:hypothetical protein
MTPDDDLAFVGDPPLWRPEADAVEVSCTFTWDRAEARRLGEAWRQYYPLVTVGGPAFGSMAGEFVPGRYVQQGIVFTSRGCNHSCPWCLVPVREGKLQELKTIARGNVVQDNNFLQCSPAHRAEVYRMLAAQPRAAVFSGGLEAALITEAIAEELRGLRIKSVFLAADTTAGLRPLQKAIERLGLLGRSRLFCYALIAFGQETIAQAEARLVRIWELGAIPFAQLYQPPEQFIEYDHQWKALARTWSRPAAIKTLMAGK